MKEVKKTYYFLDGVFNTSLTNSLNIDYSYSDYVQIIVHNLKKMDYDTTYHDARHGYPATFADDLCKSDVIIAVATLDNIHYLRNMAIPAEKLILLQFNDEITRYKAFLPPFYRAVINFDEKRGLKDNLNSIIEQITDNPSDYDHSFECCIDPKFKNVDNSYSLHISTGCTRGCKFCSIKNTEVRVFDLVDVQKSVRTLLESGVTHIKISNHLSGAHRPLLCELARFVIPLKATHEFVFSCTLIPEDFYDDIELLTLLKEANFLQINAGMEHTNEDIRNDYGISLDEAKITAFIRNIYDSQIASLNIHYIIGGSLETEKSLESLIATSNDYIALAPSVVEFNIRCLFDENKVTFDHEEISRTINGYVRHTFIHKAPLIDLGSLLSFKTRFYKETMPRMYPTLNYDSARNHVHLARCNVQTQYYVYFYSKTIMVNIYDLLTTGWKRIDTIRKEGKDIRDHIPRAIALLEKHEDKVKLLYDSMLTPSDNRVIEMSLIQQELFRLLFNSNKTVGRIIDALVEKMIVANHNEAENVMMDFIHILDSKGCIFFKEEVLCEK